MAGRGPQLRIEFGDALRERRSFSRIFAA